MEKEEEDGEERRGRRSRDDSVRSHWASVAATLANSSGTAERVPLTPSSLSPAATLKMDLVILVLGGEEKEEG